MKSKLCLGLQIAFLLTCSFESLADPNSGEFFDRNFVNPKPSQTETLKQGSGSAVTTPIASPAVGENKFAAGIPISGVGLIIGSDNPELVAAAFKVLIDLTAKYKYGIGPVILVGPDLDLFYDPPYGLYELSTELAQRGADIQSVSKIPSKYKLERSPGWILFTSGGEIVIEGFESPQKFINAKGEFVDRGMEDQATK